jgi:ABC-type sugar transport system substrate-binding protein
MAGMVIIGAGERGTRAALPLRQAGYHGAATLIGAEPHAPYERPPLSKEAGRTAGNKEVIAKHPDIRVVQEQTANYQRNQAIDLMTNWITGGEEINAVAANNDEMAVGAILAMQQAGMSPDQVCVGGVDATADALDYMQQGLLDVTVFQDAKGQGRGALDAALKLAKGEKVEPYRMIPYELVTPKNMAEYVNR